MARLVIESGQEKGKTVSLPDTGEVVFGRDTSCGYQILDLSSSRNHFKIVGSGDSWVVEDLDSRNGTELNGEKIEYAELVSGDSIRVGEAVFKFDDCGVAARRASEQAAAAAPAPKDPVPIVDYQYKDPMVGKTVGGYRLIEQIGRGGMGTVYTANQISLNRDVALKILSPKYTSDEKFVEMFVREARAAGGLNHPNIVQVYDVGKDEDKHFFSMEYMSRGSVGDLLKELGKISVPRALGMILHAAKGLEYAERRGLIHCDIKPDNLMLNDEGTVKIVDLGLSRTTMSEKQDGGQCGDSDVVFGTPNFVAPEQAQRKKLDHKVDQYSLGAAFFNMVTGRPPFLGDTAREIVMKHIKEPPPLAKDIDPAIPETVSRIIDRMLKKNPDERYKNAATLLDDLRAANIEINPQAAYTDGFPGFPDEEKRRLPLLPILGAAGVLAVLIAVFVAPMLFGKSDADRNGTADPDNGTNSSPPDTPVVPDTKSGPVEPGGPTDPDPSVDDDKFDELCQQAAETLKDVRELHKKNGDFDPIVVENYRALARKYPNTPAAREAEETANQLVSQFESHKKKEEAAAAALKDIERKARVCVGENRFGEALAAYAEFPAKEYEETEAAGEVIKGRQFIEERVKDAWTVGNTQASALERQGDFEGAKKFYRSVVEQWKIDRYSELANEEVSRIDRALKSRGEAAAAQKLAAEKSALSAAEAEATQLATAYDFVKALSRVEALLTPSSPALTIAELTERARVLISDYNHMAALKTKMISQAVANSGSAKIALPEGSAGSTREAFVTGADADTISIRLGGANTSLAWQTFKPPEFFDTAYRILGSEIDAIDRLRLGIFAMILGVPDKVEQQLSFAFRDGNPATRVEAQKALDRFRRGAGMAGQQIEARAEADYRKIVDLFQKAEAEQNHDEAFKFLRQALELFDQWREDYGHTKFVREKVGR